MVARFFGPKDAGHLGENERVRGASGVQRGESFIRTSGKKDSCGMSGSHVLVWNKSGRNAFATKSRMFWKSGNDRAIRNMLEVNREGHGIFFAVVSSSNLVVDPGCRFDVDDPW